MPIPCRLYALLNEFSVSRFHKELLLSILIGFILIDFFTCLKHLIPDHGLRYGFLVFEFPKQVSEILCLFLILLFAFGFKAFYSPSSRLFALRRRNSGKLKTNFCSEKIIGGNWTEKLDECDSFNDDGSRREEDDECDISVLRKLVKIERSRANAAVSELVKERASSATAAEETMAMILRLQNEKSSIEMESNQYRRLAEEKQIHDHQVIQSLQWLVWRNKMEVNLLQQKLNRIFKSGELVFGLEQDRSENVVENVLCSSLDFNLSLK